MSMTNVKVCLLGETRVGKSSIVLRFVSDMFMQNHQTTVGAAFMTKTIVVRENMYKFQIWDTAGQEKYRTLAPMYYRGCAAAIIVYDITNLSSFLAVKSWVHELQRHGPHNSFIAIAGNKSDLEDLREVREKDAQEYAEDIGAMFCETSALTAANIAKLFNEIALLLPSELAANGSQAKSTVNLSSNQGKKKKGCCG